MTKSEDFNKKVEKLKNKAINIGASDNLIKLINVKKDVIIPSWTRIKCQFGCPNFGKNLCCPPYIPTIDEWKRFLNEYKYGLIFGFEGRIEDIFKDPKKLCEDIFSLEREAFLLGFYKAFVYFPGPCKLCDKCIINEKDFPKNLDYKILRSFCKHLDKARPSMEATGIDVFGTIKNIGLEINIAKSKKEHKIRFYTMLLLE